MRSLLRTLLLVGLTALFAAPGHAQQRGTANEAVALVNKVVAALNAPNANPAELWKTITDPKGGYIDRDLYVFASNISDKKIVGHAVDQTLIGQDLTALRDVDGKAFGLELTKATAEGIWVDYKWMDPLTKKVEQKSSFARAVKGFVVGVGIYK